MAVVKFRLPDNRRQDRAYPEDRYPDDSYDESAGTDAEDDGGYGGGNDDDFRYGAAYDDRYDTGAMDEPADAEDYGPVESYREDDYAARGSYGSADYDASEEADDEAYYRDFDFRADRKETKKHAFGNFFAGIRERRAARKAARKPKTRGEKALIALRVIIVLAIAGAVYAGIRVQEQTSVYTESSFSDPVALDVQDGSQFLRLGSNIVFYNRDGMNCVDTSGSALWNISFEMQKPVTDVYGGVVAIADYGGSTIYVCNHEGLMGTISTGMPIEAVSVAGNGSVAAVLNDTDASWVNIYDAAGKTISVMKRTISDKGYPLNASISPSGSVLCVSLLSFAKADFVSSVNFYNFGAVGQDKTENLVSGYDYRGEVIPFTRFLSDSVIASVSDSTLAFYKGAEIPQRVENTVTFDEELLGVWTSESYVGLLFPDNQGGSQYDLRVYGTDGGKIGDIRFNMDYTSIQFDGDRVLVNSGQDLLIAKVTGETTFQGSFDREAAMVLPQSGSRLTVITSDGMETMTLK